MTPLQADALAVIPYFDKFAHAGFYFLLSFSFYFSWWLRPLLFKKQRHLFLFGRGFHILYGTVIEVLQAYVIPGRFGEWEDALANTLGVLIASLVSFFWFLKKRDIK
ncbi:MAG: VanZ family protein [Flavobacteriia bacterium]|nr:VanZ family protein [Flavobacteriia bacterium]